MPTDAEIAWFAGIFEGEGTFETSKRSTARMTIAMSDRDIIERIDKVFPCGRALAVRNDEGMRARYVDPKPMYVWRLGTGAAITEVIASILPWLGERRSARAQEVLDHLAKRQQPGEPRSTHCKRGHALTGDNLIRRGGKSPYVRCRICSVEKQRAHYERRRAASA